MKVGNETDESVGFLVPSLSDVLDQNADDLGRTWSFLGGGRVTAWSEGSIGHVQAVLERNGSFYLVDDKVPSASKVSPTLNLADFDVFLFAEQL